MPETGTATANSLSDVAPKLQQPPGLRMAELTYLIAHELRNPCTIIGGFATLLNRLVKPADKEGEYARIIMQESARMEKAIDAVLEFSQTLGSDYKTESLAEIVSQALAALCSRYPLARTRLTVRHSEEPLFVFVASDQVVGAMVEIIGHLLTNSRPEMEFELKIDKESEHGRIYLMPTLSQAEQREIRTLVAAVAAPERDPATLSLTLARESLRLNNCRLELAAEGSGQTYLYIDMPLSEGNDVESNNVR